MEQLNVLVATADSALAAMLIEYLETVGMCCDYGHNARTCRHLISEVDFDVLIVDAGLPSPGGSHICRHLRDIGEHRPILVLCHRHSLKDRIATFTAGADDCQAVECPLEEIHVRLLALCRRGGARARQLVLGDLELHLDRQQACCSAQPLSLTPTTRTLLEVLIRAAPGCVSRERLERAVWGDRPAESNTLNVHVHHLRKEISNACEHCLIETVRGSGYRLVDTRSHS